MNAFHYFFYWDTRSLCDFLTCTFSKQSKQKKCSFLALEKSIFSTKEKSTLSRCFPVWNVHSEIFLHVVICFVVVSVTLVREQRYIKMISYCYHQYFHCVCTALESPLKAKTCGCSTSAQNTQTAGRPPFCCWATSTATRLWDGNCCCSWALTCATTPVRISSSR